MPGFVDAVEAAMLDYFVNGFSPTTKYVGVSTSTPTESGTSFTEPSGGSYARVAIDTTFWAAAVAGAPTTKLTSRTVQFPVASANWSGGANFTYYGIFSLSSGGNLLVFGALDTPRPVLNGQQLSFDIGAIRLKLGDVGDTF